MKSLLYGDGDPLPEIVAQLAQETYSSDLLLALVQHISKLDFEARKDVAQIFNNLLRRQIGSRWPTVEYLASGGSGREVVFATLRGYEDEDVALNTGMILKEMVRHEALCEILLYSDEYVRRYRCFFPPRANRQINYFKTVFVPALRRRHQIWRIVRCIRQFQRDSHQTQANGCGISREKLRPLLCHVWHTDSVHKLRHQEAIVEAAGRDPS